MNLKNKVKLIFYKFTKKERNFHTWKRSFRWPKQESRCMEKIRDQVQIGKESAYMETSRDNGKKRSTHKQTFEAPNSFFTFHSRKRNLFFSYQFTISTTKTHGLQHNCAWPSQHVPTMKSLEKVNTDLGQFHGPKQLTLLGCRTQSFHERWQQRFSASTQFYNGRVIFNQFRKLRNELVVTAEKFGGEQTLTPIQIPTISKFMDEQFKQAHRVVEVVDCPNRALSVTMLR